MDEEQILKDYIKIKANDFKIQLKSGKVMMLDVKEFIELVGADADVLLESPERLLQNLINILSETLSVPIDIRLVNLPISYGIHIRAIRARHQDKLVSFNGTIKQVSDVNHLVTQIKFECPSCGSIIVVMQADDTIKTPTQCSCGKKAHFKILERILQDYQLMEIEETHENIEGNEQPKRVQVISVGNLCDTDKVRKNIPGTIVNIIGIVKEQKKETKRGISTRYGKYVHINNITVKDDDEFDLNISDTERDDIYQIAKQSNAFDMISSSIAPSVYGYDSIKKALALQLFGGVRHRRSDKTDTRENIHGLLVGDPGTAKSIMLRFMANLTQRGRFVSGKGASGVGLTASVVKSDISNGWVLEAGPLIMANGSVCAIDEGDKMTDEDRSNLHEAMSIGTLTISKANIHATLPARTSVLMAANPRKGRFSHDGNMIDQINLVPSLLSRFDFIYIIKDRPNEDSDRDIANKILGENLSQYDSSMHVELLRKYIYIAKQIDPMMSKEASKVIADFYVDLRKQTKEAGDGSLIISVTARQLESIIRFAEAHARMKLRKIVGIDDARNAIQMIKEYLSEFGYDEKEGTFDIDKIMGMSASTRGRLDLVLRTVRQMENMYTDRTVPLKDIEVRLIDIDRTLVAEAVFKLNRQGDLTKIGKGYRRV